MSNDWILRAPRRWVVPSMSGDTGPAPGSVEDCTEFAEAIALRMKKRLLQRQHRCRVVSINICHYFHPNGCTCRRTEEGAAW